MRSVLGNVTGNISAGGYTNPSGTSDTTDTVDAGGTLQVVAGGGSGPDDRIGH